MADQQSAGVRARRHDILKQFSSEVRKGFMERLVEMSGTKFLLHTPTEDDVVWADSFIRPATPLSYASSRRAPRLAAAIKRINGERLDALFLYPEDMAADDRDRLERDATSKRYWLQSQLMLYLLDDVPPPILEKLYDAYDSLLKDRDNVLKAAAEDPNSLTRTPGSAAAPT